jgi:hypothetical protein
MGTDLEAALQTRCFEARAELFVTVEPAVAVEVTGAEQITAPGISRCCGNWSMKRVIPSCMRSLGHHRSAMSPLALTDQKEFLFGVDRILDGAEAFVKRRGAGRKWTKSVARS